MEDVKFQFVGVIQLKMVLGIGATAGISQLISNIRFAGKLKRIRRKASRKSIKERIALIAQRSKILIHTLILVNLIAVTAAGCTFTRPIRADHRQALRQTPSKHPASRQRRYSVTRRRRRMNWRHSPMNRPF